MWSVLGTPEKRGTSLVVKTPDRQSYLCEALDFQVATHSTILVVHMLQEKDNNVDVLVII